MKKREIFLMIFYYIKKFLKIIVVLLLLLLLVIICFKYQELKKTGRFNKLFASNKNNVTYVNAVDPYESNKKSQETNSDESKILIEKKNYDDYYNTFNFDDVLLLYEGTQKSSDTREALDRLLQDADDSFYSNPTVIFQNFNGLSSNEISADNLEEYKDVLREARNSIGNGTYTFSFEYSKFNAIVNKIIITKN